MAYPILWHAIAHPLEVPSDPDRQATFFGVWASYECSDAAWPIIVADNKCGYWHTYIQTKPETIDAILDNKTLAEAQAEEEELAAAQQAAESEDDEDSDEE